MGLLARLRGREQRDFPDGSLENPSTDLWRAITAGDVTSQTGLIVTPEKAMRVSAVYGAVRLLSESIASLPLPVYERNGRSRDKLFDDPRWALLNDEPNPEWTAYELFESLIGHANLWGAGRLFVERDPATNEPVGLWPLAPQPTRTREIRLPSGARAFLVTLEDGEQRTLLDDEVIQVKAFLGQSPIVVGRDDIGLAIATNEFGSRFFQNDARPGGVIETDARMDEEQVKEFRAAWDAGHRGLARSHLIGILTGAHWKDVGIAPEAAQYLETRKFSVQEIARRFRVPASLIEGDKGGSLTYSTTQGDGIHFVTYSLLSWITKTQQALKRRLFVSTEDRSKGRYAQFTVAAFLRGDDAGRAAYYDKAIRAGWMSRAEVRELEDMPFVEGLDEFCDPAKTPPPAETPSPAVVAAPPA